jgi:phosphate starvation-inducible PhoH-like protein
MLKSYIYTPKTINQDNYVNYLNDVTNKIIISTGPAGTGKTLFACQKAITQMKNEEIDKIIITRPVVTVEEEIGFLPGNIIKKMDPWTKPIFDIFLEYYTKIDLDFMLNNGKIEICPLAFMRGRTFKNSFIIADEMQNSSPNQMKMLTTRLGINSRMVITGDLNQTDIPKENGLYDFVSKVEKYNNTEMIKIVKLQNNDIERSEIVKKVIEIYEYKKLVKMIEIEKIITNNTTHITNNTTPITNNTTLNTNIKSVNNKLGSINYNNQDAALIPKQHISHNFDIFFEYLDY